MTGGTVDCGACGVRAALAPDDVIADPVRCRAYECDGLTGYRVVPGLVLLPRDAAQVAAAVRVCAGTGAVRRPRRGHRAVRRRAARRGRRGDLAGPAQAGPGGRPGRPPRRRRTGRHQPGDHRGGRAARALLRARPLQPAGLHDRRQRRGELRRRALPQVRLHHATTCSRWRWCCPTGRWSRSAATPASRPGRTCAGCSSAPRARWASPRRSPCGCCARPRRCARCWPTSRRSRAAGDVVSDIVAPGSCPPPSR